MRVKCRQRLKSEREERRGRKWGGGTGEWGKGKRQDGKKKTDCVREEKVEKWKNGRKGMCTCGGLLASQHQ